MPWLARHDPLINWEKRTLVRFGRNATESDDSVSVSSAPQGASDHSVEAAPNAVASGAQAQVPTTEKVVECESNQNRIVSDSGRVSTSRGRDDDGTAVIYSKITEGSAASSRGVNRASTPGVDDAASRVGGYKRPTPEKLPCSRAAGLHDEAKCNQSGVDCARLRKESADGYDNGNPSKAGPG
ncbi:hypothetical protein PC110_g23153 [Phytophthora cactorum]|uniref:Uncharacterized protein n=1 Tax=Phytophthora cactorum TaxID=29920 RepID=A0A329R6M5_9STRA|nr:hypothetical protein PC110_g23153 [Phytophthora cactorum]